MYTIKFTMEERLLAADVAISNALGDEAVMERLSPHSPMQPCCHAISFQLTLSPMTNDFSSKLSH